MKKDFQKSVEFVKNRPGHDRRYAVDWRRIKQQLGWKPKYNFDNYLKKTIEWYQNNPNWWKPLKNKQKSYFKKQYGRKKSI